MHLTCTNMPVEMVDAALKVRLLARCNSSFARKAISSGSGLRTNSLFLAISTMTGSQGFWMSQHSRPSW